VVGDGKWGGPTSLDSPRAVLGWIPMVSKALGDRGSGQGEHERAGAAGVPDQPV